MKELTLKKVAYGGAMAVAIIVMHLVNVHIYRVPPVYAILLAILITYLGITLINKSNKFNQKISRTKYNLLNGLVLLVLFLAYYTIGQ